MRRIRFSIAGLMFVVAISALLVAALRSASGAWAGAVLLVVRAVLGLGIVGALCRRGSERAWWLGFSVFGCGYMMLAFWSETNFDSLPTTTLLIYLGSKFDPNIGQARARARVVFAGRTCRLPMGSGRLWPRCSGERWHGCCLSFQSALTSRRSSSRTPQKECGSSGCALAGGDLAFGHGGCGIGRGGWLAGGSGALGGRGLFADVRVARAGHIGGAGRSRSGSRDLVGGGSLRLRIHALYVRPIG